MSTLLNVEGGRKLRAALKAAGDDLADMTAAHKRITDIVIGTAGGKVPRRSGRLASSVRGSGTKTASVVRAGGARVPYAGPIHWGWPTRNISAQPFLVDAARATEPQWTAVYLEDLQAILDKHAGEADGTGS